MCAYVFMCCPLCLPQEEKKVEEEEEEEMGFSLFD